MSVEGEKIPGWALQHVSLDGLDAEDLGIVLDQAIDEDESFLFVDESNDNKPTAVLIPWSRYEGLVAASHHPHQGRISTGQLARSTEEDHSV